MGRRTHTHTHFNTPPKLSRFVCLLQVLESLLQHGARVDAADALGSTPLMYATNYDQGDAAGLLCDYGADVSVVSSWGISITHGCPSPFPLTRNNFRAR